jgi:sarcosine oxidase gamma subunit
MLCPFLSRVTDKSHRNLPIDCAGPALERLLAELA